MSNEKMEEMIKKLIPPKRDKQYAYKMGKDCGKNGPTIKNSLLNILIKREF